MAQMTVATLIDMMDSEKVELMGCEKVAIVVK
jgi:hypothetical protein